MNTRLLPLLPNEVVPAVLDNPAAFVMYVLVWAVLLTYHVYLIHLRETEKADKMVDEIFK